VSDHIAATLPHKTVVSLTPDPRARPAMLRRLPFPRPAPTCRAEFSKREKRKCALECDNATSLKIDGTGSTHHRKKE